MTKRGYFHSNAIIGDDAESGHHLQFLQSFQHWTELKCENNQSSMKYQNQEIEAKIEDFSKNNQSIVVKDQIDICLQTNKKVKHVLNQVELKQLEDNLLSGSNTKLQLLQKYDISKTTLERYIRQLTNKGHLKRNSKQKNVHIKPNSKSRKIQNEVKVIIKEKPKIIQIQMVKQLSKRLGINISQSSVSRTLQQLNFKKNTLTNNYVEVNKKFNLQYRRKYAQQYRKAKNEEFLDQTGFDNLISLKRKQTQKGKTIQSNKIKTIKMEGSCSHDF